MTAASKTTVTRLAPGTRFLITDDGMGRAASANPDPAGRWHPARNKRGMVVATFVRHEGLSGGRGRSSYDLVVTLPGGETATVADQVAHQTVWLAPDAAPTASEGKTLGEMTPAERADAIRRAAAKMQDELTSNAPAIAAALESADQPEPRPATAEPHKCEPTQVRQYSGGVTVLCGVDHVIASVRSEDWPGSVWESRMGAIVAQRTAVQTMSSNAPTVPDRAHGAQADTTLSGTVPAGFTGSTVVGYASSGQPTVVAYVERGDVSDTAPTSSPCDRITVKQLQSMQGVRVLLTEQYSPHAGGGAGKWTAARTAPPRGDLYVKGEPGDIHAATVTEVRRVVTVNAADTSRYDVVTNLGTVERVTAGQVFRLAPAGMRDSADIRADLRAERSRIDTEREMDRTHPRDIDGTRVAPGDLVELVSINTAAPGGAGNPHRVVRVIRGAGIGIVVASPFERAYGEYEAGTGAVIYGQFRRLADQAAGSTAVRSCGCPAPVRDAIVLPPADFDLPGWREAVEQMNRESAEDLQHCPGCRFHVHTFSPWLVLHRTADGQGAYVVYDGPRHAPRSELRPVRGEGGTVRVEYVTENGRQLGDYGWEDPATLTPTPAVESTPDTPAAVAKPPTPTVEAESGTPLDESSETVLSPW